MTLRIVEFAGILLTSLTFGVFWGPWVGLTRSMASFDQTVLVPVVHRMDRNLGGLMTVLFPITLLAIVAELVLSFGHALVFSLVLAALGCLVVTLIVTLWIEVPVVEQIRRWTVEAVPEDWQRLRNRWVSFHLARVIPGFLALALLVGAAVLAVD